MNPAANNWQYYAVTPLTQALVKTNTTIRKYNIDAGLAAEQQLIVDTISPGSLVQACLQHLDSYRAFAAGLNREALSNDADEAVGRLTIAINDIISIIVDSVAPLFQYLPNTMHLNAAQQTLRSALEQQLADAYGTAVIMVSTITGNGLLYHDGIAYPELDGVDPYSIPHPAITAPSFVISQQAAAAYPGTVDTAQLNRWVYTVAFSRHAIAYGSRAYIQFNFGDPAVSSTAGIEVNSALLNSLLQLNAVAPQIMAALLAGSTTEAQQLTALQTLAQLAEDLVNSWKAEPVIALDAPADTTAAAWQLEEYTDTSEQGEQTGIALRRPINEDWPAGYWPEIFVDDSNTPLPATLLSDDSYLYAADLAQVQTILIALPQLHAFAQSKLSAGIATQQNCFSSSTIAPHPAFAAFTSPFSWVATAIRPHLQYTAPIALSGSHAAALQHFFTTVTGNNSSILLQSTISHQYQLGETGLPVTIPVLHQPYAPWQEAVAHMPEALQQWIAAAEPQPGYFVMAASLTDGEGVELMRLERCEMRG